MKYMHGLYHCLLSLNHFPTKFFAKCFRLGSILMITILIYSLFTSRILHDPTRIAIQVRPEFFKSGKRSTKANGTSTTSLIQKNGWMEQILSQNILKNILKKVMIISPLKFIWSNNIWSISSLRLDSTKVRRCQI